jgi:hypothetical protein
VFASSDLGGGVPLPLMLIYKGLPLIKLLLFRAFLESLDFVTHLLVKLIARLVYIPTLN